MREQRFVHRGATREKQMMARQLRNEMTVAEKMLWNEVRKRRCAGLSFRRQQVICGFIVDFFCPGHGIIVEVDGPIHDRQIPYDEERDTILRKSGAHILRFSNEEVLLEAENVVEKIARFAEGLGQGI